MTDDGRLLALVATLGVAGASWWRRGSRGLARSARSLPSGPRLPATLEVKQLERGGRWSILAAAHPFGERGSYGMPFHMDGETLADSGRVASYRKESDAIDYAFDWASIAAFWGGRPRILRVGPRGGGRVIQSGDEGTGVRVRIRVREGEDRTSTGLPYRYVGLQIETAPGIWRLFRPDVDGEEVLVHDAEITVAVEELRKRFKNPEIPVAQEDP